MAQMSAEAVRVGSEKWIGQPEEIVAAEAFEERQVFAQAVKFRLDVAGEDHAFGAGKAQRYGQPLLVR